MTAPTPAPVPAAPLTEAEDKQWAGLAHLLGIIGILPSLIIYLVFKDRGARTRVEAKEALNWQITVLGVLIILYIVYFIFTAIAVAAAYSTYGFSPLSLLPGLVGFLIFIVAVVNLIFSIIGFTKVNAGGAYRYPVAIRLIK